MEKGMLLYTRLRKTQQIKKGGKSLNYTEYDYSKLRGKIKEVFCTQKEFALAIGISDVSISNKLNNISDWRQEEIEKCIECLKISYSEIHTYFFTKKVENNST